VEQTFIANRQLQREQGNSWKVYCVKNVCSLFTQPAS
jgi:hypothetical protein